jgi:hypothetical protein
VKPPEENQKYYQPPLPGLDWKPYTAAEKKKHHTYERSESPTSTASQAVLDALNEFTEKIKDLQEQIDELWEAVLDED